MYESCILSLISCLFFYLAIIQLYIPTHPFITSTRLLKKSLYLVVKITDLLMYFTSCNFNYSLAFTISTYMCKFCFAAHRTFNVFLLTLN